MHGYIARRLEKQIHRSLSRSPVTAILGSAYRDLIRQSTESLAGRIAYLDLTPFLADSFDWRVDFIKTFMERDIPGLGFTIPVPVMERLWMQPADPDHSLDARGTLTV